jgi:K+-transporting ATPase KdpF subunit
MKLSKEFWEDLFEFMCDWRRHKLPFAVFLLLCINAIVAPAVYAQVGNSLAKTQAYAIALLGLVTITLSVYLFMVIFQPERF